MKNNIVPMSVLIDTFHNMMPNYDRNNCRYYMDGHNTLVISAINCDFVCVTFTYNGHDEWCISTQPYLSKAFQKEVSLRNELSVQQEKYNNLKRSIKRHEQT